MIELLKSSVKDFNQYRISNPKYIPNLRDANLSNTNLSNANLSNATLTNADLHYTNLYGADLSGADLSGTILRRATLNDANLWDTIGNGYEIQTLQLEKYTVVLNPQHEVMWCGCTKKTYEEWRDISHGEISSEAQDWWSKYRNILMELIG